MKKQLKDYLPPILLKTYEFPLLWLIEQQEIDLLSDSISEVFDSQYILTAPLRGIERYEKIFKIIPYDTDTLEDRRFRILSKFNIQLPFTVRMLKQQLALLCGENGFTLKINHNAYKLEVKVALIAKRNLDAVKEMLDNILPANMERYCSLLYNQHLTLGRFTHAQISGYTHTQVRNEVIKPTNCIKHLANQRYTHSQLSLHKHEQIRVENRKDGFNA